MRTLRLSDVRPGETLIADAGFTCVPAGPVTVLEDAEGRAYFTCGEGRHYLEGQTAHDDDDSLVGLARPAPTLGRLLGLAGAFVAGLYGAGWLALATLTALTRPESVRAEPYGYAVLTVWALASLVGAVARSRRP